MNLRPLISSTLLTTLLCACCARMETGGGWAPADTSHGGRLVLCAAPASPSTRASLTGGESPRTLVLKGRDGSSAGATMTATRTFWDTPYEDTRSNTYTGPGNFPFRLHFVVQAWNGSGWYDYAPEDYADLSGDRWVSRRDDWGSLPKTVGGKAPRIVAWAPNWDPVGISTLSFSGDSFYHEFASPFCDYFAFDDESFAEDFLYAVGEYGGVRAAQGLEFRHADAALTVRCPAGATLSVERVTARLRLSGWGDWQAGEQPLYTEDLTYSGDGDDIWRDVSVDLRRMDVWIIPPDDPFIIPGQCGNCSGEQMLELLVRKDDGSAVTLVADISNFEFPAGTNTILDVNFDAYALGLLEVDPSSVSFSSTQYVRSAVTGVTPELRDTLVGGRVLWVLPEGRSASFSLEGGVSAFPEVVTGGGTVLSVSWTGGTRSESYVGAGHFMAVGSPVETSSLTLSSLAGTMAVGVCSGTVKTVSVATRDTWTVASAPDWVMTWPKVGETAGEVSSQPSSYGMKMAVLPNYNNAPRTGTVTLRTTDGTGLVRTVSVTQAPSSGMGFDGGSGWDDGPGVGESF